MLLITRSHWFAVLLSLCACASINGGREREVADNHDHSGHEHESAEAKPLGWSISKGWADPWVHAHRSWRGTPYVHGVLTEPAFLGRDLFLTYSQQDREKVLEAEIEYALSRRVGVIVEGALVDNGDERGFGDTALGVRAMLAETERYLLSASIEIEIPSGDEDKDLGSGAWGTGLRLHGWLDLGAWFSLQFDVGGERFWSLSETALPWGASLIKSLDAGEGTSRAQRLLNIHAEVAGESTLSGESSGETEGLWFFGISFDPGNHAEIRGGYTRSFNGDDGFLLSLIVHF